MAVTVESVIIRAAKLLKDEGYFRYTTDDLVEWVNDGIRRMVSLKPDATAATASVDLVGGTRQLIPANGDRLLRVIRNLVPSSCSKLNWLDIADWTAYYGQASANGQFYQWQNSATLTPYTDQPSILFDSYGYLRANNLCAEVTSPDKVYAYLDFEDAPNTSSYVGVGAHLQPGNMGDFDGWYAVAKKNADGTGIEIAYGRVESTVYTRQWVLANLSRVKIELRVTNIANGDIEVYIDDALVDTRATGGLLSPLDEPSWGIVATLNQINVAPAVKQAYATDLLPASVAPGDAINLMSMDTMNSFEVDWHQSQETTVVKEFSFNQLDPRQFYVYPPNDGEGNVELVYSQMPNTVVRNDNIPVSDVFSPALVDYVVSKGLTLDTTQGAAARAQDYYNKFLIDLGLDDLVDEKSSPNQRVDAK